MAEQNISLYDLLNLSISSPGQGAVNFRAMYTLLHGILRHLGIREVTVNWNEAYPGESFQVPEIKDGGHGQSQREMSAVQEAHSGSGAPQETAPSEFEVPGGQGTPREDGINKETGGDMRHIAELIERIQKQTDHLQDNVKELRHQQEKAAGVHSELVKTVEGYSKKVNTLEEAMRHPDTDDLSRYVTWEAMKSALITERENIQKGLILAKDIKEVDVPKIKDTSNFPSKTQTTGGLSSADSNSLKQTDKPGAEVVPPLKTLSQRVCGSSLYPETVEALRTIGRLQQRCDSLEARISALDQDRTRDHQELLQLRDMLNRDGLDIFDKVKEEVDEQKAAVKSLLSEREKKPDSSKDMLVPELRSGEKKQGEVTDHRSGVTEHRSEAGSEVDPGLDLLRSDLSELRRTVNGLRAMVYKVEGSVKELRAKMEATTEEKPTDQHLQDQLDSLRGMLEEMMVSLTSELSLQHGPVEDGSEMSGFRYTALGLGSKLSLLFQQHEQLQDAVSALLQQHPATATGRDGQNAQLVSGVQKAILHLQAECEKLHETTRCLHEDNQQKQTHIEELYKTTEELEEKKADKNMVETEIRADKNALESKVSRVQFDSVTEQLSNMFNELLNKVTDQEQDWNKLMEKLSNEMDCKLNRIELDSVKKQLEARWKSIQERMKNQGAPEQDDAAGIRKQLVERFHCLSCDRPVLKHTPGPQLLTLPASPGFQPQRSMRPFTVYTLEQIRQHYRSLSPGTNRFVYNLWSSSRKREELQRSYDAMCQQIDRLRQEKNQSQSERIMEVADYSLYSVSRSCGGSHTVKSSNQRRSGLQHNRHQAPGDDCSGQSEEVDIVGLDGHIYKGRLNASLSRNAETKLPTIATKDGSSKSRERTRSSLSPRPPQSPEGHTALHPPSTKSPSCPSACCSSGRDWPVSALGCTSQSSIVPMSVNAPGSSPTPEQAF